MEDTDTPKAIPVEDTLDYGGSRFTVSYEGCVESVQYKGGITDAELYCRTKVFYGKDWRKEAGHTALVSQLHEVGRNVRVAVFNLPLNCSLTSTSLTGWPQLIVSVYGLPDKGSEGPRGYGRVHLPSSPGETELTLRLFKPETRYPVSSIRTWSDWYRGRTPEMRESYVSRPDGKHLVKTKSYGTAHVKVKMMSQDLHKFGYDNKPGLSKNIK